MTLKKSHKWEDVPAVYARCPHCGWWNQYEGAARPGDIVGNCKECGRPFKLGRRK